MRIGNRNFDMKDTYIVGILNVTPDSFSDGGKYYLKDEALFKVEKMIEEGVDLVDIGGESTRPGSLEITALEELERVIPVIENIRKNFDIPLSLDTYKAEVAVEGIKAGIHLINDIWGLKKDKAMAKVIADHDIPCCLMHNRLTNNYKDLITDVVADLKESLLLAKEAGICKEHIILDPGIGFGKSYEQNLDILAGIEAIVSLGYPLLLGVSRKSVIGNTLQLPVDQRLSGSIAVNLYGMMKGCSFLRVHDVKEHKEAVKMLEAILNRG